MAVHRIPGTGKGKAVRFSLIGAAVVALLVALWFSHSEPRREGGYPTEQSSKVSPDDSARRVAPHAGQRHPVNSSGGETRNSPGAKAGGLRSRVLLQPPVGTRVVDVLAQLKSDADAGEPAAACRVGAELARCWTNRELREVRARNLSRLGSLQPDSDEARRARTADDDLVASTRQDADLCAGVADDLMDGGWRYLLNAALRGNVAAMEQFVLAPPLSPTQVVSSLEGWGAYRDNGSYFLQRSIEAGSVRALYFAFLSAATGVGIGGSSLLPRDPYQAIVYGQAALPLVDAASAQMIMNAMPELNRAAGSRAPQATMDATALRQRYFAGGERTRVSSDLGRPSPERCLH